MATTLTALPPATLDRDGIAARIPHAGAMCLLDALERWDREQIVCRVSGHADRSHPLRLGDRLPAAAALEYASQAMALHGALCAGAHDRPATPRPGFLASARGVRLHVRRLDDRTGPLRLHARCLSAAGGQAMYRFELTDGCGRPLVDGRATVVLDRPLAPA